MLHPHTELRFINDVIGYGVVATRPIPKGTITWARCAFDRTFERTEAANMPAIYQPILEKYAYVDRHDRLVLCWDLGRFINHSCRANCLSAGFEFEIAVRDIAVGEELTDDYGTLNPDEPMPCECGAPDCRGSVLPDDPITQGARWDTLVRAAFPAITQCEQPLWDLVEPKDEVLAAVEGRIEVPSIRIHYPRADAPTAAN